MLGIMGQILKLDIELIHKHAALLQVAQLLTHALNDTCWDVMSKEVLAEVIPANHLTRSGVFVLLPPISCLVLELERSKLDIVLRPNIAAHEMLLDVHKPIFGIQRIRIRAECLGHIREELVESSELRLMAEVSMDLIVLVVLIVLKRLHHL